MINKNSTFIVQQWLDDLYKSNNDDKAFHKLMYRMEQLYLSNGIDYEAYKVMKDSYEYVHRNYEIKQAHRMFEDD